MKRYEASDESTCDPVYSAMPDVPFFAFLALNKRFGSVPSMWIAIVQNDRGTYDLRLLPLLLRLIVFSDGVEEPTKQILRLIYI